MWGCLQDGLVNSSSVRDGLSQYYNATNARIFRAAFLRMAVPPAVDWSAWVGPKLSADTAKYAYNYFKSLYLWLEKVAQTPTMMQCVTSVSDCVVWASSTSICSKYYEASLKKYARFVNGVYLLVILERSLFGPALFLYLLYYSWDMIPCGPFFFLALPF